MPIHAGLLAIIVARGSGLERGLGLLEDREEEERLRGAGMTAEGSEPASADPVDPAAEAQAPETEAEDAEAPFRGRC